MSLDLARAVPDALDAGVAPPPLDLVLTHQTHATEHLYGAVGDASERLGGHELGHGHVGVGQGAVIDAGRGLQREQLGRLDLESGVGQLERQALELADRLTELLTAGRPAKRLFEQISLRGPRDDSSSPVAAKRMM